MTASAEALEMAKVAALAAEEAATSAEEAAVHIIDGRDEERD